MAELNDSYKDTINVTIKSLRFYFVITGVSNFLFASRQTIWIQYASTFSDYSPTIVTLILFIDSTLAGLFGLSFAALGDFIGFDKAITYKLLLMTAGCIIEAVATNFTVLCVGFLISQTATTYVSLAYISWILPVKYAKKHTSLLYAFLTVFYLLGPVFSGVLFKLFKSYKLIFVLNSIILSIILIVARIYLYGSQQKIEQLQMETCSKKECADHERLLDLSNDSCTTDTDEIFPSSRSIVHRNSSENRINFNFCKDITFCQWFRIMNVILTSAICVARETSLITYFVPFIMKKYGEKKDKSNLVVLCTLQILTMAICFIGIAIFMSKISDSYLPKLYRFVNPNLLIIILAL
eukprot:225718_1